MKVSRPGSIWVKLSKYLIVIILIIYMLLICRYYRLLLKIIDFYFSLFYSCLMTSAGGNLTYLSHGENKLNYHRLNPNIFANFSSENCRCFTIVYLLKTMKLCTTTFGKLKIYFTSGTLRSWCFAGQIGFGNHL